MPRAIFCESAFFKKFKYSLFHRHNYFPTSMAPPRNVRCFHTACSSTILFGCGTRPTCDRPLILSSGKLKKCKASMNGSLKWQNRRPPLSLLPLPLPLPHLPTQFNLIIPDQSRPHPRYRPLLDLPDELPLGPAPSLYPRYKPFRVHLDELPPGPAPSPYPRCRPLLVHPDELPLSPAPSLSQNPLPLSPSKHLPRTRRRCRGDGWRW